MDDMGRTGATPEPPVSPEEQLHITVKPERPGVVVVHVAGDLDLFTASVLREQLTPQLVADKTAVLLDLTELGFLGSAGLAELVAARDVATRNGARMLLVANSRSVLRPLEVTGLHTAFQVFESIEPALREV